LSATTTSWDEKPLIQKYKLRGRGATRSVPSAKSAHSVQLPSVRTPRSSASAHRSKRLASPESRKDDIAESHESAGRVVQALDAAGGKDDGDKPSPLQPITKKDESAAGKKKRSRLCMQRALASRVPARFSPQRRVVVDRAL